MVALWDEWEKSGKDWKSLFDKLFPLIRQFAAKYNLKIIPWHARALRRNDNNRQAHQESSSYESQN